MHENRQSCIVDKRRAKFAKRTLIRAIGGERVDRKTAEAIAKTLETSLSTIADVGTNIALTDHRRDFDPGVDKSLELVDTLREFQEDGRRLGYFHQSMPFQLLPKEMIVKYNGNLKEPFRSYWNEVGTARRKDYESDPRHGLIQCVMKESDIIKLCMIHEPYNSFTNEDVLNILNDIEYRIRQGDLQLIAVPDGEERWAEALKDTAVERFVNEAKSYAMVGDRFVLKREKSDDLYIKDGENTVSTYKRVMKTLISLADYTPSNKRGMIEMIARLKKVADSDD